MRRTVIIPVVLHALAAVATLLWLLWYFIPTGNVFKGLATLLILLLAGWTVFKNCRRQEPASGATVSTVELPLPDTRGPVVLVCGDMPDALFQRSPLRKTAQGWWLRIGDVSRLTDVVRNIQTQFPRQVGQLSVMYRCLPDHHQDEAVLRSALKTLRQQCKQIQSLTGFTLPVVLSAEFSGPETPWIIVRGDKPVVPESLKPVILRTLDLGLLQAGAGVKGEFEQRLKNVISAVQQSPVPVLLFIDEAHTIIGAGNQAGGADAANLLKPALARGELRTIAATTWSEYKQYFERDAALERRFQMVKVDEPDDDTACLMLRGLKSHYAEHHGVHITDEAVKAAVTLSRRYLTGRQLPDKAVDLLDTASARISMSLDTVPEQLTCLKAQLTDGTEVAIAYSNGDIDLPYIAYALHDSEHPDHVTRDNHTRNVLRTPANNKLRMEDKRGEEHIKLATEYGRTQLNSGHLVDAQGQRRGKGTELRTDEWGTLRAGKGLFVSADAQAKAQGDALDMSAALKEIDRLNQQLQQLEMAAEKAQALKGDVDSQIEMFEQRLKPLNEAVLFSAPEGVALTSGEDMQLAAERNLALNAGEDFSVGVMGNATALIGEKHRVWYDSIVFAQSEADYVCWCNRSTN